MSAPRGAVSITVVSQPLLYPSTTTRLLNREEVARAVSLCICVRRVGARQGISVERGARVAETDQLVPRKLITQGASC